MLRLSRGHNLDTIKLTAETCPACLAYVDLNPIRAGLVETPETSARISEQPPHSRPFVGNFREEMPTGLPFRLDDHWNWWNGPDGYCARTNVAPSLQTCRAYWKDYR